jgi:hypothetical protein
MTFKVFSYELSFDNIISHGPASDAAYPRDLLVATHFLGSWTDRQQILHKLDALEKIAFQMCMELKKAKETTLYQRLNFEGSVSVANSYNMLINNAEMKLQEERVKKLAADALYQKLKIENTERINLQNEAGNLKQSLTATEHSLKALEIKNQVGKSALQQLENSMQMLTDDFARIELKHKIAKAELTAYEEGINAKYEKLKLAFESGTFSSAGTSDGEYGLD